MIYDSKFKTNTKHDKMDKFSGMKHNSFIVAKYYVTNVILALFQLSIGNRIW